MCLSYSGAGFLDSWLSTENVVGVIVLAFSVLAMLRLHWLRPAQIILGIGAFLLNAKVLRWALTSEEGIKTRIGLGLLGVTTFTFAGIWVIRNIQKDLTEAKEKRMSDEKPKGPQSPSQTQTNINSPFSQQHQHITYNQGERTLTAEQRDRIANTLRTHTQTTIHVLIIGGQESIEYANQIAAAIRAAGWSDVQVVLFAEMAPGVEGVSVQADDPAIRAILARAFSHAQIPLQEEGLAVEPRFPNAVLVGPRA